MADKVSRRLDEATRRMSKRGPAKTDDLIAVDDAATAFDLSRATMFRLISEKKLKSFKRRIGDRKTYVSRSAVKRLLMPQERQ